MSAWAKQFKSEIIRISNKQVREQLLLIKKSVLQQKREATALKSRIATLEQLLGPQASTQRKALMPKAKVSATALRFSAARFSNMRKRLGLTAAQAAALLGVSDQSVYKWEQAKSRPRATQLVAIAKLRTMGKRQVAKRLSELQLA